MRSTVASLLMMLTVLFFLAPSDASDDAPPDCVCSCRGRISCDRGQWAYCECKSGTCYGKCYSQSPTPKAQASAVISQILNQKVQETYLDEHRLESGELLRKLLSGRTGEGQYSIKYESRTGIGYSSRTVGFAFSKSTVRQLESATRELEGRSGIMY
jgi:hypothetical protein